MCSSVRVGVGVGVSRGLVTECILEQSLLPCSMEGSCPNLPAVIALKKKYKVCSFGLVHLGKKLRGDSGEERRKERGKPCYTKYLLCC